MKLRWNKVNICETVPSKSWCGSDTVTFRETKPVLQFYNEDAKEWENVPTYYDSRDFE